MTDAAPNFYETKWDRPWLTPSIANVLLRKTPYHARMACPYYGHERTPPTPAMIEGSVVDSLVLGGRLPIVTMRTKSWNTNAIKESKRNAEMFGNIVLKQADYDRCADAAREIKEKMPPEAKFYLAGTIKRRIFWKSGRKRVECSTEPDIHHGDTVLDLKRTRIVPTGHNWRRHASNMGYHIQAAAVLEATKAKRFGWVIVEADPPHLSVVHWATPAFLEVGKRDWHLARDIWHDCVTSGEFPAYVSEDIDPAPWLISDEGDDMIFTEETE